MQLKITWQYIIAFIAFNFILLELHEQAHINTGYLVCGCYGPRDFNIWQTCATCNSASWTFLATLAGPLFSCTLMWLGAIWFSKSNNRNKQYIGFALLFANLPFARIFTALVGGGDEKIVVQSLMGDTNNSLLSKIIASVIVVLICLPPMIMVFKKLITKHRWWIVVGFAIVPLIYGMLYQHMLLNSLLKKGIAPDTFILGTPNLVLYHFLLMLLILFLFGSALLYKLPNK